MKAFISKVSIASAALLLAASAAHASLIQQGSAMYDGSGLGGVNTILTIHANDGTEQGGVSFNGTKDVLTFDALKGNSQTGTASISSLNIASAADLRIVFNASEPGGDSITLENLVLNIYSNSGTLLFTSGAFASQTFETTATGTGNAGYVFKLDDIQAADAQQKAFGTNFGANRIGLFASVSSAAGGNETFFVGNTESVGGPATGTIPEPSSVALLGLGLLGAAAARRKAKKQ